MPQEIVISIPPNPAKTATKVEAFGFQGPECSKATAPFIEALAGPVENEEKKPEYHEEPLRERETERG